MQRSTAAVKQQRDRNMISQTCSNQTCILNVLHCLRKRHGIAGNNLRVVFAQLIVLTETFLKKDVAILLRFHSNPLRIEVRFCEICGGASWRLPRNGMVCNTSGNKTLWLNNFPIGAAFCPCCSGYGKGMRFCNHITFLL